MMSACSRLSVLPLSYLRVCVWRTTGRSYKPPICKSKADFYIRGFAEKTTDPRKMVDPKRVLSYDDVLKVISQPEKVLIDVRNPEEVNSTGKIPSSINIPLGNVQNALTSMSEEEFKREYQRNKPSSDDELIFYCQSGKRSSEALDKALKLGYSNSKTYLGSWSEWSSKQK